MIELEKHFGEMVWTNTNTDPIRRDECMCLKCDLMTYDKETNCPIAQAFYEQCVEHNVAFMMTRCKTYVPADSIKVVFDYDNKGKVEGLDTLYLKQQDLPKESGQFVMKGKKYYVASATYTSPDNKTFYAILTSRNPKERRNTND